MLKPIDMQFHVNLFMELQTIIIKRIQPIMECAAKWILCFSYFFPTCHGEANGQLNHQPTVFISTIPKPGMVRIRTNHTLKLSISITLILT